MALRHVVGLALALGLAAGAVAADTRHFDISIAGIRAGELVLSGVEDGARYDATSRIRATGLLAAVARLRYDGQASGRIAGDGRLVPERYTARSRSTRSERETTIVFENGAPVQVRVEPPRAAQADPAAQAGTIDPVTAAFALLLESSAGSICNRRVDLFDGSRRSQVVVGRAERRQDGAYVCNGRYLRLEGEAHAVSDASEWPFRLVFRDNGGGAVELERIETPTRFGTAVVSRRG